MRRTVAGDTLAHQKLAAFTQLQPEFEASFCFVQDVHGQRRFAAFAVTETVRYLHALWICECKDQFLSVYKNIVRYEGQHCLHLLRDWQAGETAAVVAFLQRKLDGLPFADLTHQIHDARIKHPVGDGVHQRLVHGCLVLLSREMNLMQALDSIFTLPEDALMQEVRTACIQYGHTPSQIAQQLAAAADPIAVYAPHQLLAQRNMVVMNQLARNIMTLPTDLPGKRSWKVVAPIEPSSSFAESVIGDYRELIAPTHNNLKGVRFVDRLEPGESMAEISSFTRSRHTSHEKRMMIMNQESQSPPPDLVVGNVLEIGQGMLADDHKTVPSAKLLADTGTERLQLLAFQAGQSLREHQAPGPIHVQVLQGHIAFTTAHGTVEVPAGTLLQLAAQVPHSLIASGPALVLVTMLHASA